MKNNFLKYATVLLVSLNCTFIQAQISDISFTASPIGSYNWFDKNSLLSDGTMYGVSAGFGFGKFTEFRAIYERSHDLTLNFDRFEDAILNSFAVFDFDNNKVDFRRYGGEFKFNIAPNSRLGTYLTLGSGIQSIKTKNTLEVDDDFQLKDSKSESIYLMGGLGVTFRISDRINLNLEGRGTVFNQNSGEILIDDSAPNEFQEFLDEFESKRMTNLSLLAGLQFYLGGYNSDQMSDLDRAYLRKYSDGLRGFKLIIEPGMAYVDFNSNSDFRDSYFLGGTVGFDFNDYVGIRAFYYKATENKELSFDFDNLSMYGGEFIGRLNTNRGVVPYITVGGGYLNAYSNYAGTSNIDLDGELISTVPSGYFAKGGVGLAIPLSQNLEIFGSAKLMYTSEKETDELQNISSNSELMRHSMYNAGIRLRLGEQRKTQGYLDDYVSENVDQRTRLLNTRIQELEEELEDAYRRNDTKKALEILEEKERTEKMIQESADKKEPVKEEKSKTKEEAKKETAKETTKSKDSATSKLTFTPEDFESIIERVIQRVDEEELQKREKQETLNRIDELEKLLKESRQSNVESNTTSSVDSRVIEELRLLNENINQQNLTIESLRNQNQVQIISPESSRSETIIIDAAGSDALSTSSGKVIGILSYQGVSAFTGLNVGDNTTTNFGIRFHYIFERSGIELIPDAYYAVGSPNGFGINANVQKTFNLQSAPFINPYIGTGLGFNDLNNNLKFGVNLIVGTSFDVLNGNLFFDYTSRSFFDNNQFAVGYRFFM